MGWKLRTVSVSNLRYDEDECAGKRVTRQRPQQEIGRAIVNRLRRSGQSTRGDTPGLRQNLVDNSAMNIGEAHVAAAKWVGQFGVVQS